MSLVGGACVCVAVAVAAAPAAGAAEAAPRPVILIGLDGADWQLVEPLAAAGRLPTLARLLAAGRTGVLKATPPLLSPILWTTIATGRRPEDHEVLDFMVDLPSGGQAPVGTAQRRVEALWTIASSRGRRVAVIGWWATAPAETVNGVIVSDRVAPQLLHSEAALVPGAISPALEASRLVRHVVRARDLRLEDVRAYLDLAPGEWRRARAALDSPAGGLYRDPIAHLMAIVAATRTVGAMAADVLSRARPDLMLVYLEGIDSLSHRFVRDRRRGTRAIERAYQDADALVARLAASADPRSWVVVCSDHGFHKATAAIREDPADLAGPAAAWHRPYGIVAAAEAGALTGARGGGGSPGVGVGVLDPLDVAPTVLQALGLPASLEMPGRVVNELLPPESAERPLARVRSYEPTRRVGPSSAPGPEPEALARLRALGYVGAGTTSLARQNLGEVLYRAGKLAEAERELQAVVDAQPANVAALLWLAKTVRDQGRARGALDLYRRALEQPGDQGDALIEAVELAAGAGLTAEAGRLADGPGAKRVSAAAAAVARAIAAKAQGRAETAERELREALAAESTCLPALSRLLEWLAAAGRPGDARLLLERAAIAAPDSPSHLALAGAGALAAGDPGGALRFLEPALRLAPDAPSLKLDLARARVALGQAEPAIAALDGVPPSLEKSVTLGAAEARRGAWTEAVRHYREALARGKPSPELLNGLAWAELQLGRRSAAAELLERSLTLRRDQPEISRLLAQVRQAR